VARLLGHPRCFLRLALASVGASIFLAVVSISHQHAHSNGGSIAAKRYPRAWINAYVANLATAKTLELFRRPFWRGR
jgi:hypothetical protein